jgi:hypothetical protein
VFPVKYELGFYIRRDRILHSHRNENLNSYKQEYICATVSVYQFVNLLFDTYNVVIDI